MQFKRMTAILATIVFATTMIAGCGSNQGETSTSGKQNEQQTESVKEETNGETEGEMTMDDKTLTAETPIGVSGGQITGVSSEDGNTIIYKGVPYAAAPVGDLRWKAPQPVESWEGVKACDEFSKICPQSTTAYGDFQKEFYSDPYPEMSEDCLYLNIWTPAKSQDEKLPVMVYIDVFLLRLIIVSVCLDFLHMKTLPLKQMDVPEIMA